MHSCPRSPEGLHFSVPAARRTLASPSFRHHCHPAAAALPQSLPLAADEADAASWERQAELARALLAEVEAERQGWPTTVEQDRALLEGPAEGASSANCSTGLDGRLAAAVQYRMQRKLLVLAAGSLLQRFLAS